MTLYGVKEMRMLLLLLQLITSLTLALLDVVKTPIQL